MTSRLMLLAVVVLGLAVPLHAEMYTLNVRRIEQNLYQDRDSKLFIETRYCYEYTYGDDAVLKWEGRYGDNWIVFRNGTKCDVIALR